MFRCALRLGPFAVLRKSWQCSYCRVPRFIPYRTKVWQPQDVPIQVHLEWLEREEALKMEPHLHCVAALWSPNTAIVDSHRSVDALFTNADQLIQAAMEGD